MLLLSGEADLIGDGVTRKSTRQSPPVPKSFEVHIFAIQAASSLVIYVVARLKDNTLARPHLREGLTFTTERKNTS